MFPATLELSVSISVWLTSFHVETRYLGSPQATHPIWSIGMAEEVSQNFLPHFVASDVGGKGWGFTGQPSHDLHLLSKD